MLSQFLFSFRSRAARIASVKLNNVAAERKELIARLEQAGLEHTVNQYEMELVP